MTTQSAMATQSLPRISLTAMLIIAATVVSGLFDFGMDRALVATPAWRDLGVQAWADYDARHGKPVCRFIWRRRVRSAPSSLPSLRRR